MRSLVGGFVVVMLGLSTSAAGAGWVPGTPWSTCSAPADCSGTLYVRRIHTVDAVSVSHRHARPARRVHARPIVRRTVRPAASHHTVRVRAYDGRFQYITDPREAAVTAWADIVNRDGYRR